MNLGNTKLKVLEGQEGEEHILGMISRETCHRGVFSDCTSLVSINLPSTLTKVGEGTFYGRTSLESIDMSGTEKVSVIGGRTNQSKQIGAFEGCSSLKAVKLSPSISSIEDRAFRGCYALNSITIPSGVKRITFNGWRDKLLDKMAELADNPLFAADPLLIMGALVAGAHPECVQGDNAAFSGCSQLAA